MITKKYLLLILLICAVSYPALAQSKIFTDAEDESITSETIPDLTALARYGRGTASNLAWSPDSRMLNIAGAAGVWRYDVSDLTAEISPLRESNSPLLSIAFHPDGERFITGATNSRLQEWSEDGNAERSFSVPYAASFTELVYSSEGSTLISATGTDLLIWDMENGEQAAALEGHSGTISALAISSSNILASAAITGEIILWDIASAEQTQVIPAQDSAIVGLTWQSEAVLLIATADGLILIYDALNETVISEFRDETGNITALAWDSSRERIITGTPRNSIHFYNPDDGSLEATLDTGDDVLALALSPDNAVLAVLTQNMILQLWAMDDLALLAALEHYHKPAALQAQLNPDATQLAVSYADKSLLQYDLETGEILFAQVNIAADAPVNSLAYNADGTVLAIMDNFGVTLQDAENGEPLAYLDSRNLMAVFAWSPDGSLLLTGDRGGNLEIWDSDTGERLLTLTDHSAAINSISFSADGNRLVTTSNDGTVWLYGIAG